MIWHDVNEHGHFVHARHAKSRLETKKMDKNAMKGIEMDVTPSEQVEQDAELKGCLIPMQVAQELARTGKCILIRKEKEDSNPVVYVARPEEYHVVKKMPCHKCGKDMLTTPVCCECGRIPLADASFADMDEKVKQLRRELAKPPRKCH